MGELQDDFYIMIYDEEIKRPRAAPLKHRILGFWCFNAGFEFNML
jgi:hypothetical protein